jgi:hypothetical protein
MNFIYSVVNGLGIILVLTLASSCSSIESGTYLVAHAQDQGVAVPQDYWRTYGLPSENKSLKKKVEASVGHKRPIVYKRSFDNDLSYILYPVIQEEQALFFGPILLTVLPVWFIDQSDTNDQARARSVTISWYGDVSKAERIVVRCFDSGERFAGVRCSFVKTNNHMECVYTFNKELTDGCKVEMKYADSEKVERVPLISEWGIEWTPYVRLISAPEYPESYPGYR